MHMVGVYLPSIGALSVGLIARELTSLTVPTVSRWTYLSLFSHFLSASLSSVPCFASSIINLCEIKRLHLILAPEF